MAMAAAATAGQWGLMDAYAQKATPLIAIVTSPMKAIPFSVFVWAIMNLRLRQSEFFLKLGS